MQETHEAPVGDQPTLARTKTREHKAAFRDSLLQSEPFAFGTRDSTCEVTNGAHSAACRSSSDLRPCTCAVRNRSRNERDGHLPGTPGAEQ